MFAIFLMMIDCQRNHTPRSYHAKNTIPSIFICADPLSLPATSISILLGDASVNPLKNASICGSVHRPLCTYFICALFRSMNSCIQKEKNFDIWMFCWVISWAMALVMRCTALRPPSSPSWSRESLKSQNSRSMIHKIVVPVTWSKRKKETK